MNLGEIMIIAITRARLLLTILTLMVSMLSTNSLAPSIAHVALSQGPDAKLPPRPQTTPRLKRPRQPTPRAASRRTASSSANATRRQSIPDIEMVSIPGGIFMMGSPKTELESAFPQHRVTVPDFKIGKYEVTQAQWRAVMGSNPSKFKGEDHPVESISWNAAVKFCRRLSLLTGKKYRLPSEAEWEYAARAGATGEYASELDAIAWYKENSGGTTHAVGQKRPNNFGLYDMHGNVAEWCQDYDHDDYRGAPIDGSAWLKRSNTYARILRGSDWETDTDLQRFAKRFALLPFLEVNSVGFRVVEVTQR